MRLPIAFVLIFTLLDAGHAQPISTDQSPSEAHGVTKNEIAAATRDLNHAMYYVMVKNRVDQIFKDNPPTESGGRLYGTLVIRLPLKSDGAIFEGKGGPQIERSSGSPALDKAVIATLRAAAPFASAQFLRQDTAEQVANELQLRLDFVDSSLEASKPVEPKFVRTLEIDLASAPALQDAARRRGKEGKVVVRTLVSETGIVKDVMIERSSGYRDVDMAAIEAAWKIHFKPYIEDLKPVAVWTTTQIVFRSVSTVDGATRPTSVVPVGAELVQSDARSVGEKIRFNTDFIVPDDWTLNDPAEFRIRLAPNGAIVSITAVKSSGLPDFDAAVRRAIEKSQPFPPGPTGAAPLEFIFSHRPRQF